MPIGCRSFFVLLFAVMIGRTMGRWGLLPPGYRRSVMPTSPATDIRTAGLVPDRRSCYNNVLKMFQKRLTMPSAYVILFVSSENPRNFSGAKEPPYIRLSTSIPYVAQPLRERKSTMAKTIRHILKHGERN